MSKTQSHYLSFLVVLVSVSLLSSIATIMYMRNINKQEPSKVEPTQNSNAVCDRGTPYRSEPEFERALSLIKQRFDANPDIQPLSNIVTAFYNCLNIQYLPDEQMLGAEGLFTFDEQSTGNNLQIFVSTKYQATDDLLTATLLVHELTHAFNFASGRYVQYGCYGDEARAFANQLIFVSNGLNKEEKASLLSRYKYSQSVEVTNMLNQMMLINSYPGETINSQAENMVKSSKFYQKECES